MELLAGQLDLEAHLPTCVTQTHIEDCTASPLLHPAHCTSPIEFQPLDLFILA